jgi:drug/metabolite transporter (DMT)-like permease
VKPAEHPIVRRLYASAPLLLCLAVLGWSGNFVVGRLVGAAGSEQHVPPIQLSFLRWIIATALLVPVAWRGVRADAAELRARWRSIVVLALTGVAIFNTFVYRGLESTTVVNGVLLQSVCPVLIVLLTFAAHRERPHAAQVGGLLVSLVGVWLVVSQGHLVGLDLHVNAGDAWILAAVAAYAVYTVVLRDRPAVRPLTLLVTTFGLGALMVAPFAALELAGGRSVPATPGALAAVAYVGVIPSIVSFFCFNRGVELIGATRAGQFIHLMPVFGAALAFLFVGERLAWYHLLGGAVIGCGIWLSGRQISGGNPADKESVGGPAGD